MTVTLKVTKLIPDLSARIDRIARQEASVAVREVARELRNTNLERMRSAKSIDGDGQKGNAPSTVAAKGHSQPLVGRLDYNRTLTNTNSFGITFNPQQIEAVVKPNERAFPYGSRPALSDVIGWLRELGYSVWGVPTDSQFDARLNVIVRDLVKRIATRVNRMRGAKP